MCCRPQQRGVVALDELQRRVIVRDGGGQQLRAFLCLLVHHAGQAQVDLGPSDAQAIGTVEGDQRLLQPCRAGWVARVSADGARCAQEGPRQGQGHRPGRFDGLVEQSDGGFGITLCQSMSRLRRQYRCGDLAFGTSGVRRRIRSSQHEQHDVDEDPELAEFRSEPVGVDAVRVEHETVVACHRVGGVAAGRRWRRPGHRRPPVDARADSVARHRDVDPQAWPPVRLRCRHPPE